MTPAPYTNLLPPAPPMIERQMLLEESFDRLGSSILRAAESFAKAIEPAIKAFKEICAAFGALRLFLPPSSVQPAIRYALAGHPYGNNTRGKKKWLLEQKRRMK